MDFIVKLPLLKEPLTGISYDTIVVIVDILTKYAYFKLYRETSTAEDLAYIFNKIVIIRHGILEKIISNRDKLFIL